MIYPFERVRDGAYVEEWFSMADAPEIGSVIELQGEAHRRLPAVPEQLNEKPIHFMSYQMPEGWPYAKDWERKSDGSRGFPRFSSRHELTECLARANAHGEDVTWDP